MHEIQWYDGLSFTPLNQYIKALTLCAGTHSLGCHTYIVSHEAVTPWPRAVREGNLAAVEET